MTYLTANHSTITNHLEATKVSSLASKDSNKNEILNSFKAGKHEMEKLLIGCQWLLVSTKKLKEL